MHEKAADHYKPDLQGRPPIVALAHPENAEHNVSDLVIEGNHDRAEHAALILAQLRCAKHQKKEGKSDKPEVVRCDTAKNRFWEKDTHEHIIPDKAKHEPSEGHNVPHKVRDEAKVGDGRHHLVNGEIPHEGVVLVAVIGEPSDGNRDENGDIRSVKSQLSDTSARAQSTVVNACLALAAWGAQKALPAKVGPALVGPHVGVVLSVLCEEKDARPKPWTDRIVAKSVRSDIADENAKRHPAVRPIQQRRLWTAIPSAQCR